MKKYQRKQETIVGIQWTGRNHDEMKEFIGTGYHISQERTPGGATKITNGKNWELAMHMGDFVYREVKQGDLSNGTPRTMRPDYLADDWEEATPESAILAAQYAVESMPAHELLTEAVKSLGDAMAMVKKYAATAGV